MIYDVLAQGHKVTSLPVSAQDVVYTHSFPIFSNDPSFSFEYKAASDGNVALKLEFEQSNVALETEYEANADWVIPDDVLELNDALTDELLHIKSYPPSPTKFGRVKITGLTGNDASTTITRLIVSVMR